ncbi:unnamed protein product [Prunus armeniaca]
MAVDCSIDEPSGRVTCPKSGCHIHRCEFGRAHQVFEVSRGLLLELPNFRFFLWQISICQVINDVVLPARVLINLYGVNLFYLFDAWKVNVFDRDEASELGVQC